MNMKRERQTSSIVTRYCKEMNAKHQIQNQNKKIKSANRTDEVKEFTFHIESK